MINFIKMKRAEWKIKAFVYCTIANIMDNQKELICFLQKMYTSLKDVPADEFQSKIISKLDDIIHSENRK